MKTIEEIVVSISSLQREDLERWVSESIVQPTKQRGETVFADSECARIELICSLYYDLDIETETLPVVLDLIEQLHETRWRLRALGDAVLGLDDKVRQAVLNRLETHKPD